MLFPELCLLSWDSTHSIPHWPSSILSPRVGSSHLLLRWPYGNRVKFGVPPYMCAHTHTPPPFQYSIWIRPFAPALCWIWRNQHNKAGNEQGELYHGGDWSNVTSITQNVQEWPCADNLQQMKTEASSTGPNRDSGSHGQLGLISDCLYPLLCVIKYHRVLKKRILEVSWPLKWQGDFTSLL